MKKCKKLYWLEYTDCGPLVVTRPFEAVGFETKYCDWGPADPDALVKQVLPELESWHPDVVAFWMSGGYFTKFTEEPREWLDACRFIREHRELWNTKIMAFFGFNGTREQESAWRERYDFHTKWPLRVIEHARTAKRLVGEEVKGFEGVNYYLLHHGNWNLQEHFTENQVIKGQMYPGAKGQFAKTPVTRLLAYSGQEEYGWIVDSIRVEMPTRIVYIVKDKQAWQGGLNAREVACLATLAEASGFVHQFLIGVNEALLRTDPSTVIRVIKQAQQAGGWQVFVNEHLWFEGVLSGVQGIEEILYEGKSAWPIAL